MRLNNHSQADRFIPNRSSMSADAFAHASSTHEDAIASPKAHYQQAVDSLLPSDSKILSFKKQPPAPKAILNRDLQVIYSQNKTAEEAKSIRHIPQSADRVLDAPEFRTDFYLNLIDWSSTNVVSVALGDVRVFIMPQ
jgi:cell division cycle 20, cofactor of APC complex